MKKFLFTLASLVAFGFAANAGVPVMSLSENEVTMGAGETKEFTINLESIDLDIKGLMFEWNMVNPSGELMTEGVTLQFLQKYGSRARYQYFGKTGITVDNEDAFATSNGIASQQADILGNYTGRYVLIASNTATGVCYYSDEATPAAIGLFTVEIGEGWEDEYADFTLVQGDLSTSEGSMTVEGNLNIRIWNADYVAPQPQLEDLTGEIVIGEPTEDGVVAISYTGDEDVTITVTVNGEEVALTDGAIQLAEGVNTITVTVEAEGYNPMTAEAEVEWYAPVVPEVTEAPVITYETTDDAVIVTAAGNGEVILYCNGQVVENPCTIARGEQDATYTFTATAQEAGKEISTVTTLVVTVPAVEVGPGPEDPHMTGYWMVMLDKNNEPVWYEMFVGANGDYTTVVALEYGIFGRYDHDAGYRGNVPFYFMIDGVRYGANGEEIPAVLGTALDNELFETEGYYTVPVGYNYNMGVAIGPDGDYYVYVAQAGFVGVDELNANKAVAGVRYFNMAGQEMQEANGMTIVVTTYTDGTTSAVKVMK